MNISNLTGLWILAFALPLIALYILKTKRVRQRVSSTWLWQRAAKELKAKHPFRRLRWILPLMLQLLALSLIALAATRPFSNQGQVLSEHTVIVLDTSASMQAKSGNGTRLDEAKAIARRRAQELARNGEVMLVSAASGVRVVSPFERDRMRLLARIDAVAAEDTEGSLSQAIDLATARLRRTSGRRKLLLITDGALADRTPLGAVDTDFEIITVGEPVDNAAIVHIDARRADDAEQSANRRLDKVRVFVRVHNFGGSLRNAFVTLRQRNVKEPLASRSVQLKPQEDAPLVLTFEATPQDRGTGLIVELDPKDALEIDDRAFTLVPEGRLQRVVLLETTDSPWLERALLADPDVEVFKAKSEADMVLAGSEGALLVYSGACPERLPSGHFLIVAPPEGQCLTTRIGPRFEQPKITSFRETDPRLRFLSLAEIHLQAANTIDVDSESAALLRTQRGVVMAELELQGRVGTLVAFDFGESDWPLKASFVLFVRNLVEQVREQRLGKTATTLRAGSAPVLAVPLDVDTAELASSLSFDFDDPAAPSEPQAFDAKLGLLVLPPFEQSGFHQVSWKGKTPGSTLLSVSLLSEKESDLRERPVPRSSAASAVATGKAASDISDWAWLLALVALLALLVEVSYSMRNQRARSVYPTPSAGKAR